MLARRAVSFKKEAPGPGADIEYVGSDTANGTTAQGAQSDTVTVPAGATFALVCFGHWSNQGAGETVISGVSLDSVPAVEIFSQGLDICCNVCSLWRVSGFNDGNVSLQWTNDTGSLGSGTASAIAILFYRNVNTAPIRDVADTKDSKSTTVVNIPLTAQNGDVLVGFSTGDNSVDMDRNGQTQRVSNHVSSSGTTVISAADKAANADNDLESLLSYGSIVGVSLIKA